MKNKIGTLLGLMTLALTFQASVASAYYDPELGRFIQPDTIIPDLSNPQSYNRYSYCLNDPLRYTDPSGHQGISTPANFALGMTASPGTEAEWNQRFRAANVQATALEVGALAGTATSAGVIAVAPAAVTSTTVGSYAAAGVSGAAGGYVGNGTANVIEGQPFNQNGGTATGIGAGLGLAGRGIADALGTANAPASTAIVKYDPKFAAEQILGGSAETPGGRIITDHAARQMTTPPPGRVPMTAEEIDKVLDTGNKITKINPHPQGTTVTVQQTGMAGKPKVAVDAASGNRVVTVIKNKD